MTAWLVLALAQAGESVSLREFTEWVESRTGREFAWREGAGRDKQVIVRVDRTWSRDSLLRVHESILCANDCVLIRRNAEWHIVPAAKRGSARRSREFVDATSTRYVRIRHADLRELARKIRDLCSIPCGVIALEPERTIVITDGERQVERLEWVLRRLDEPPPRVRVVGTFVVDRGGLQAEIDSISEPAVCVRFCEQTQWILKPRYADFFRWLRDAAPLDPKAMEIHLCEAEEGHLHLGISRGREYHGFVLPPEGGAFAARFSGPAPDGTDARVFLIARACRLSEDLERLQAGSTFRWVAEKPGVPYNLKD